MSNITNLIKSKIVESALLDKEEEKKENKLASDVSKEEKTLYSLMKMLKKKKIVKESTINEDSEAILKKAGDKKRLSLPTGNKSQAKLNPPVKENLTETVADKVGTPLTMAQQIKISMDPYGVLNDSQATSTEKDHAYQLIQIRTEGFITESVYKEHEEEVIDEDDEEDIEEDDESELFSEEFLLEKVKEAPSFDKIRRSKGNKVSAPVTSVKKKKSKTTFSEEEKAQARAKMIAHPANHMNIVNSLENASPEEHRLGKEWYPHAQRITRMLADHHGPAIDHYHEHVLHKSEPPKLMHIAAGLMGLYSPQSDPNDQSLKASVSMQHQKGVGGKGKGFLASAGQAKAADKIINGTPWEDVMGKNKIHHYTHLIEHGGNEDNNKPYVAVDTHAMSVAHGVRFNGADYATHAPKSPKKYKHYVDLYKAATEHYNAKHGTSYKPHEVQAITWLHQQRKNKEGEIEAKGSSITSKKMEKNAEKWRNHADDIGLESKEMNVSGYSPENYHKPEAKPDKYKKDDENEHQEYLRKIGFHDHEY